MPHLHRDWTHPCHICTGTGLAPATSAPGLGVHVVPSSPYVVRICCAPNKQRAPAMQRTQRTPGTQRAPVVYSGALQQWAYFSSQIAGLGDDFAQGWKVVTIWYPAPACTLGRTLQQSTTCCGIGTAAPNRGTPNRGTPNRGAPNRGAPNRGAHNRGTPNRGTPNRGTPNRGTRPQSSHSLRSCRIRP